MIDGQDHLFVTGAGRSGTTLVDKLMSLHPQVAVLSQPLPLLYVEIKKQFNNEQVPSDGCGAEISHSYPLNDLFNDRYTDPDLFSDFLKRFCPAPNWFAEVLASMRGYSGQYTKPNNTVESLLPSGPVGIADFVVQYLNSETNGRSDWVLGSKETFAEEFIPYFLDEGAKVLLLLRDPRDVAASVYSGKGPEFAGAGRPLLFVLRQWRKSVAFALRYGASPNLRVVRYEDLVSHTEATLNDIAAWLNIEPFPRNLAAAEIQEPSGNVWQSNSSHAPTTKVSKRSVGTHRSVLSDSVVDAIEIMCGPEMLALGYLNRLEIGADRRRDVLRSLVEVAPTSRPELQDYEWNEANAEIELARLRDLEDDVYKPSLHLFQDAFNHLRRSSEHKRTVLEARASTVLFNLSQSAEPGYFLVPANICPEVPLALALANRQFRFVDIDPVTLCLCTKSAMDIVARDAENVAGIIFARTYGAYFDVSAFFAELKSIRPDIMVIDDRCACRPNIVYPAMCDPNVDAEVYSSGYAKYVDLGWGGFAHLRPGLVYNRQERVYDPSHESELKLYLKTAGDDGSISQQPVGFTKSVQERWPGWLNTQAPSMAFEEYAAMLSERLPEADAHKRRLNEIYRKTIPSSTFIGSQFNDWRYAVQTDSSTRLLEKIFAADLFASNHYRPATHVFGGGPMPEAERLYSRIVNLFNDHYADDAHAIAVAEIVKRHVLECDAAVATGLVE